jgi:Pro-kumamolisin, activation domain/IPT/TIG domain
MGVGDSNGHGRRGYRMFAVLALFATPALTGWGATGAGALSPTGSRTEPRSGATSIGPVVVEAAPRAPLGAKALGAVAQKTVVSGELVLDPSDNAKLVQFIANVTDKVSSSYGRYLQPGAFASEFGPQKSALVAVESQLRADGLRVTGVSRDDLFVSFRGDAGNVERAFHTGLESYRLSSGSIGHQATSPISVPATISRSVLAVIGLNDLVEPQPVGALHRSASSQTTVRSPSTVGFPHAPGSATACADARAAATAANGLTDDEIAHAYGASGLYAAGDLGSGQHIALYELEPFSRSDVKTFDTCYFGADAASAMQERLHVIPVDGGQPTGSGSGESIMDIEDLSAMAPGAEIDVYEGPSPGTNGNDYDPIDPYVSMINTDYDQVMSSSWGLCEQAIQQGQPGLQEAENLLFEQAAAQGQSMFGAAGDNGSDDCNTAETSTPVAGQNPLSLDDPASQPYVVSVGGTTITSATEPPSEHVWNDGSDGGGGGGGISESWTMPAWQRESTVPGIALPGSPDYRKANQIEKEFGYSPNFCQSEVAGANSSTPCRLAPDVSAQADWSTGAVTVFQAADGGWATDGGTSSSTPIWASMVALSSASPTCASDPVTSKGVGFVSPLLYSVASSPSQYAASFDDVTVGNNDIYGLDDGSVFPATTGYDLASGLGSPRLTGPGGTAGLAYYLCASAAAVSRPVVSGLSPSSGPVAGGTRVTISGKGFESGGKSDVATIEIGAAQIATTAFTVRSSSSISAVLPPALDGRPPVPPAPQDGAGPADVIVMLKDDQSSRPGPSSIFQYVDTRGASTVPSISGVVPYGGAESAPPRVNVLGSDFSKATRVSFGGVVATNFTVVSPYEISVTPPSYSQETDCSPLPKTGVYVGENAKNDICQVQVSVANSHGASAEGHILPPYEGAVSINNLGVVVTPPGCHCESAPVPSEFDYLPPPHVTSVSTSSGPASLASEKGVTLVTVHGTGFDPLDIDWVDFGASSEWSSEVTTYDFVSGNLIQLVAPAHPLTVGPANVPLSVSTLGGDSLPVRATYAGVPRVTGVVNTVNQTRLDGTYGAPDTGQTPIRIAGTGFAGQLVGPIEFNDTKDGSEGTQYSFAIEGNHTVKTETVQQIPGLVDVQLCTVTACSRDPHSDRLYLYAPGNPSVTSVDPDHGAAAGGTKVTIGGENLGCPLYIFFGNTKATSLAPIQVYAPAGVICRSSKTLGATSPAGLSGTSVPVSVMTIESYFTGAGRGTTTAKFTYT